MSDRIEQFEVGRSVRITATTRSGDIIVLPGSDGIVKVAIDGSGAERFDIEQLGDLIVVEPRSKGRLRTSSADVVLTVPPGASLELAGASGDIRVQAEVATVRAGVASGDVRISRVVGTCRVNSASGDITIDEAGDVEVNTASGTVRIGTVQRSLRLNAASGDAFIDEIGTDATCKVASGDVRIGRFSGTELRFKAMSGDLRVGIPPRRTVDLDLRSMSGEFRNHLPSASGLPSEKTVVIAVTTVSGDLVLRGA